ncbi:histidinol dehydrogenase [Cohnella xylanilytica]|uniref:Histidinol dehydrogenase n=1 Tax=Cohnella xylanilytica TaxID=557555 RepID=A0A841U9Y7_9BACL|nr:histidinol dehydrogenase [Cohnella xylanilytica]MBB6695053.1 histidinol dehydrogenase [Cohnella xylanilytica]
MLTIVERSGLSATQAATGAAGQERREAVLHIIEEVKRDGDAALFRLTEKFDRVVLPQLAVADEEFEEAYRVIDPEVLEALREAIANIRDYHERQLRESWMTTKESGTILGQLILPLERVGLYVPGGTAAYPTSVMMNAVPALVAGVKEIVMTTPPGKDGKLNAAVLVAAAELGIRQVYKVGGAQAIAALAYGTETIGSVDKITGPGNAFVATAKREVFGQVAIDMIAGPSEVVVLADETAKAAYIAADLLAQAEHDPLASVTLVTTSRALAEEVQRLAASQLEGLDRKEIAAKALEGFGAICVAADLEEAIDIVNELATEHLEIQIQDPFAHLGKIKHAGAIFIGDDSPVAIGDYFVGTNHVLPTGRTARFSSGLSVDDFLKKTSFVRYSRQDMLDNGRKIAALARFEGLQAHARSVELRLERK